MISMNSVHDISVRARVTISVVIVSICATVLITLTRRNYQQSKIIYLVTATLIFGPAVYWALKERRILSLGFLFVGYVVKESLFIFRYGMFPGTDNYDRYRATAAILQGESLRFFETGPSYLIIILDSVFASLFSAWLASLLFTAAILPIGIYIATKGVFEERIALTAAVILSQDFVTLLFAHSLLKGNTTIYFIMILIAVYLSNHIWNKKVVLLTIPLAIAIPFYGYTGVLMSGAILLLIIFSHSIFAARHFSDLFRSESATYFLFVLCGMVYILISLFESGGVRWHFGVPLSFVSDLLGGDTIVQVGQPERNERAQFVGGIDLLSIYNWIYRLAMMAGAGVIGYVALQNDIKEYLKWLIVGVPLTGLPVIWLSLPVFSTILHASRVARYAMIFYAAFVAVCVLWLGDKALGISKVDTLKPVIVSIVILSVIVAPSAYKSTESLTLDKRISNSADINTKTVSTARQRHVWLSVSRYRTNPISAVAQFETVARMEGDERDPILSSGRGLIIVKKWSLSSEQILTMTSANYNKANFDHDFTSRAYDDGEYIALWNNTDLVNSTS